MIGRFVRVLHSKSSLINCVGVGRRTLFILVEFFPTPQILKDKLNDLPPFCQNFHHSESEKKPGWQSQPSLVSKSFRLLLFL
ncbi:hypothetical protein DP111_09725 [Streptococcus suis]|nr:hypothetical protein DP111_09725 [Streptococcus suis]